MNEPVLYSKNANFINSLKFKIPTNASIINLKVRNINFFSKFIPKGKIAIYGNYEILTLYNIYLPNGKCKKKSICKKVNFYKAFKLDDSLEHISYANIKSEINYITSPKCYYSTYSKPHSSHSLVLTNFCKVYMLSSISFTLVEKESIKKILSPQEKIQNNNLTTNKKQIKKRYIEATTIIGSGSVNFFMEKEIDIPKSFPPIWITDSVQVDIELTDISFTSEKIIASGLTNISINYKTLMTSYDNVTAGELSHLKINIPFCTPIDLIIDDTIQLKKSDVVKVVTAKCLDESHVLNSSILTPSNEVVYNKITEQLVIQINVIATRKERIFI